MAEIQPDPRFPWIIDPMGSKIHFQKLPRSNGIQELLASFTIGSEWTIDSTLHLVERSSGIIDRVYGIDVHIWSRFRISLPGLVFPVPSPLPGLLCPGPSVPPASFPPRSYLPVPPRHRLFRPLCADPSIRSSLSRSHSLVLSVLVAPSVLSVPVPPRSSVPVPFPGPYVPSASVPFPGLLCPGPVSSLFRFYPGPLCPGSITVLSVPVPYRFHLFRSHTGSLCSGPSVPPASVPPQVLFVPAPPPVQTVCSGPDSRRSLSRSLFLVHFIPIPHAVSVPSPVLSVPFPPPVLSAPVPLSKSLCPPSRYPVFSVRILLPGPLYPTPILSVLVPFTGPICPSPTPTMLSFPQWSEKYWSCQVVSNKPLPDDTRARSWVESGRCSLPVLRHAELVQTTAGMVRICLSVHSFQC